MSERLEVRKTYKLFIGGAFPRSESGRTMPVTAADGRLLAHVAKASRKDVRDAVRAARSAQPAWAGRTAYNRGQILYRIAEVLEGRAGQMAAELEAVGVTAGDARADVESAIDAAVYWAGFADKLDQLVGAVNPVSGPFLNLSNPIPLGVCALACPDDGGVRGVLGLVAPAIMAGNAVVALAGGPAALVTSTLGRGRRHLRRAGRRGQPADGGRPGPPALARRPRGRGPDRPDRRPRRPGRRPGGAGGRQPQAHARTHGAEDIRTAMAFCEIRTVWHPARI